MKEVHNDCDALKEILPTDAKIESCNICNEKDDCNSGSILIHSFVLFVLCLFVINRI